MSHRSPSPSRLAGQLRYLLEERPELRAASVETLRDRLSAEDRSARARARDPLAGTADIEARAAELDDRIALDSVREARALAVGGAPTADRRGGELGAVGDDTPPWLFLAAAALFAGGIVGWFANLAVRGADRATWTGGALLVLMALALGSAVWSHRHTTTW